MDILIEGLWQITVILMNYGSLLLKVFYIFLRLKIITKNNPAIQSPIHRLLIVSLGLDIIDSTRSPTSHVGNERTLNNLKFQALEVWIWRKCSVTFHYPYQIPPRRRGAPFFHLIPSVSPPCKSPGWALMRGERPVAWDHSLTWVSAIVRYDFLSGPMDTVIVTYKRA